MIRVVIASAAVVLSSSVVSAQSFATPARGSSSPTATARALPTAEEHIVLARSAVASGDFDAARREYLAAVTRDREAGRLPTESTMGLVQMLYAQSYTREASYMLDLLANEAAQRADVETEARARADALWLKAGDGRWAQAREDATRLRSLIKQGVLSADTQRYVATRFR
ncbi:hypothetical protein [Gemmatimonas sp.]|uniref:hypothetical protein n=1 Tax=Gemmatimonas sp. TaxID=1962908 RepID=UPI003F726D88